MWESKKPFNGLVLFSLHLLSLKKGLFIWMNRFFIPLYFVWVEFKLLSNHHQKDEKINLWVARWSLDGAPRQSIQRLHGTHSSTLDSLAVKGLRKKIPLFKRRRASQPFHSKNPTSYSPPSYFFLFLRLKSLHRECNLWCAIKWNHLNPFLSSSHLHFYHYYQRRRGRHSKCIVPSK